MFILVFVCVIFVLIPMVCIIHYLRENKLRLERYRLNYENETVIQGNKEIGTDTKRIKVLTSYKKNN